MNMMAPIPGMSLTQEPGNAPYEQPPLYNTGEEALGFYFEKFEDEDNLDNIIFALEHGYPVESFVDAMTSVGVMEGFHSVDVKLLISPVLHEYLVNLAEAADIDFVEMEGPSKEDKVSRRDKERTKILLQKALETDVEVSPEAAEKAEEALEEDTPEMDSIISRRLM